MRSPWTHLRTAGSLAWGVVLSVTGWHLVLGTHAGGSGGRTLGFAAVCAGQLVFMALVADRWFPKTRRGVTYSLEGVSFGLVAVFLVLAGWSRQ
ncbi:MAG TPA: hypothetical protein VD971_01550 [Phycisphaerales bacterium]|nr:hypothetical protein [Phycisphaerales bacterium]